MAHPETTDAIQMPPGLSFEQKWDFLKPYIERLYVHEMRPLAQVIEALKAQYAFDATTTQYKYQINKKWRLRKNIPTSKKVSMNQRHQSLSTAGMSAVVKYKGQVVDSQKLRRQAKMETRRTLMGTQARETRPDGSVFPSALLPSVTKLLMSWNLPYKPSRALVSKSLDYSSPLGHSAPTPSDVSVGTPYANVVASPNGVPSPLSSALRRKTSVERARMFLQGDHQQLIASMSSDEQVTISTWLYQFWFFSFKTAKYWGRGPRDWFADILGFLRNKVQNFPIVSSQNSPFDMAGHSPHGQVSGETETRATSMASMPSPLCRWTIHAHATWQSSFPNPPVLEEDAMDHADPGTYQEWPKEWKTPSYTEKLRNALESNDFSNIPADQLPAAIPEALQVSERSPYDLAPESWGFAIMSRNLDMISDLLEKGNHRSVLTDIDAFHLATSYLDGSKSCCDIINTISGSLPLRQHYTNELGHTVLDNLMIAIMKGHSSCSPHQVDDAFKGQTRFAGEEVDICGRWDADSDCVRELLTKGIHHIPFQWKHKFCHTSIQTICHSISTIWGAPSAPDINTCSGLFVRRCSQPNCGFKMQMTPLHTLVLVTLQLSSSGCEGEDLFGAVAVLLCFLRNGADPSLQSDLSATSLISGAVSDRCDGEMDRCDHNAIDPLQLAKAIYALKHGEWTDKVRLGWRTCCKILQHAQHIWAEREPQELSLSVESEPVERNLCEACEGGWRNHLGRDGRLGLLWAVVKTELVTYSRLDQDHSWLSENVNLEGMLESLRKDLPPDFPLVKGSMMKPTCCCRSFKDQPFDDCIGPEDASAFYFSNMEDWFRTTFLCFPERDWY